MKAFTKVSQIRNVTGTCHLILFLFHVLEQRKVQLLPEPRHSVSGTREFLYGIFTWTNTTAGGSLRHNKLFMIPFSLPPTLQSPGPSDPKPEIRYHLILSSLSSHKTFCCLRILDTLNRTHNIKNLKQS